MRRPVLAAMAGLTAVVLGLGIRAGVAPKVTAGAPVGVLTSIAPAAPRTSPAVSVTTSPAARRTAAASAKVNGTVASTRYGPVQVQITVASGRITAADAVVYPAQEPRDQEINSSAVPQLDDEALQAQSARIDTVSGATYTSDGYVASLQSAIDQAHAAGLLKE